MIKMSKRFGLELFIGASVIAGTILFGAKGSLPFILFLLIGLIEKMKLDEREYQIFYKVGNYSFGAFCVGIVLMDMLNRSYHFITMDTWMQISIGLITAVHGLVGLILFNRE
jgi:hypothetical protein